jgi:thiamine biosynthesis lipoprotein
VIIQVRALGTDAWLALSGADDSARAEGLAVFRRELAEIDAACSRFRTDSDLSRVNAAAGMPVAVGPLLIEALEAALVAAEITDGDVDPTCGQTLIDLGYDRDFAAVLALVDHDAPVLAEAAPAPGWRRVTVDRVAGTVAAPAGCVIDLGATAKALAADRAAERVAAAVRCGALVNLGGDVAVSGPAPDGGWWVRAADIPGEEYPAGVGQVVTLTSGGVATSGITARQWQRGGYSVHHIIDPHTGSCAQPHWRAVTVAAATCLEANVASTCAIIRGRRAIPWLRQLGLPSRLVGVDGRTIVLGAWPVVEREVV